MIFMLMMMFLISALIASLCILAMFALTKKSLLDAEKISPFECGFVPLENSWQSFSLQFFLVSLIFLIFDIELILLYPYIALIVKTTSLFTISLYLLFLILLTAGFAYEWSYGQLEWFD